MTASPIPRWLPNAISAFRLVLVPFGVWVAEWQREAAAEGEDLGGPPWLLLVLLVLGGSDLLDGWLARRYSLTTRFGATLDAFADKIAQITFVTYFAFRGAPVYVGIPMWFWGIATARDAALAIGYLVLRRRRGQVDTEHAKHGKAASLVFSLLILSVAARLPVTLIHIGIAVVSVMILGSAATYVLAGWRELRADPKREPPEG
ncbi:MAG: CDP-alcohol phosphatidyltransferase family protein [Polyangiaceae bacterium]